MATLRQDLLRSTYQDQQLKAILSINTYMKDLDARTSSLAGYVTRNGITADIDDMFDHLADVIRGTGLRSDASNSKSYEKVIKAVKDSKRDPQSRTDDDRPTRDEERRRRDNEYKLQQETAATIVQTVSQIHRTIQSFMSDLGISIDQMITRSTRLIESSNTMVFNTGYTYSTVQQYRDQLKSTVDDLNSRYARAQFDYNDSLDLINTIINQTGIKDINFYETYGELFLKTSKSMNIHLGSLAEFSDKFYKRYNFSSMNMEEMLTSIRENTAGTSLTDEQVRDFLMSNQTTLAQYADQIVRTQGGDFNTILTGLNDNFAESLAYLNKLGLDNSQINTVMDTLMKASTDKSGSEAVELMQVGIQGSDLDRFMSDPLSVVEKYVQGAARLGGSLASNFGLSSTYASAAGLKNDELYRQLYLTSKYGNFITAEESTESNPEIAEDPLRERYVTISEHISNKASTIADTLADIQESIGVDLPFLRSILDFLKDIFSIGAGMSFGQFLLTTFLGGSTSGGLLGKLGGLLGTAGGSGSGLLAAAGPIAAAVVAVGVSTASILDAVNRRDDQLQSEVEEITNPDVTLDEGQYYGYGDVSTVNEDGTITTRKGLIDTDTPAESNYEDILDQYSKDTEDRTGLSSNLSYWERLGRAIAGTGHWKKDAKWYNYIPIFGSIGDASSWSEDEGILSGDDSNANRAAYKDYYINYMNRAQDNPDLKTTETFYTENKFLDPTDIEELGTFAYNADLLTSELRDRDLVLDFKKFLKDGSSSWHSVQDLSLKDPFTASEDVSSYDSYDVGTAYVPEDQLAYIHQGEAIIPESQNPFNNPEIWSPEVYVEVTPIVESTPTVSDTMDTSTYDQRGFDDIISVQRESRNREESQLSILIEYTQKIFDFINYWKDDYETREDLRLSRENVKSVGQSPMTSTAFG